MSFLLSGSHRNIARLAVCLTDNGIPKENIEIEKDEDSSTITVGGIYATHYGYQFCQGYLEGCIDTIREYDVSPY